MAPLAEWLGDSARAVWEHHERFDGQGYPRGLSGTDISFAARVVSVADSYDVMTSARSYKKPLPAEAARVELAACAGSQFDPVVVRSFLNISLGRLRLMTGPLAWFAQLALFEPSGVVHAGSSSIQSGGAASSGSTGAATAGAAASTGKRRCGLHRGGDRRERRGEHGGIRGGVTAGRAHRLRGCDPDIVQRVRGR